MPRTAITLCIVCMDTTCAWLAWCPEARGHACHASSGQVCHIVCSLSARAASLPQSHIQRYCRAAASYHAFCAYPWDRGLRTFLWVGGSSNSVSNLKSSIKGFFPLEAVYDCRSGSCSCSSQTGITQAAADRVCVQAYAKFHGWVMNLTASWHVCLPRLTRCSDAAAVEISIPGQ